MLTLPITVGKKYVRRDGKTITALPTSHALADYDIPMLAGYNEDLICVATAQEADLRASTTQERLVYPHSGKVSGAYKSHPYDLVADAVIHPHAALIDQYANDWKTRSDPWEFWEFLSASRGWEPLTTHPFWLSDMQYRRKPAKETVTINGKTINAPMRRAPKTVTKAWHLSLQAPYVIEVWPEMPQEAFDKNVIFYTKEDAEAARLAIIAALGTSKEIT